MFSRNRKKISILALTLASLQFASPAQARQNWYDSLKDYFKQQIGSVDFNTNPDQIQKQNIPQSTGHDKPKEKENIYLTDFNTIFAPGVITNPDIVYGGPTMLLPFRVNPASAYDPIRQRYLLVWEQAANLESSEIRAQYYSSEGVAQGSEMLVSSARPTHGCLYAGFASDRPNLSPLSPENCQKARNPSVAYSNGKFLILWELGGTAPYAYNAHYRSEVREGRNILVRTDETPTVNEEGKVFSNIIAKLVNADDDLSPANPAGRDNNWNEGILISQFNVSVNQDYVYNRSTNRWDAFNPATAADIDVQAWWVSKNPRVAALNRVAPSDPTGFVVTWDSNRNFTDCREPLRRNSTAVFARYIDENFLGQIPSGMTNPNRPAIAISRDVSGDPANTDRRCAGDVQEAVKPKLAVLNSNDIAFTYEANTTSFPAMGTPAHSASRIGLKKINLSTLQGSSNDNNSSDFGIIFPSMGMEDQKNPDLLNYRNQIVLAYDDARSIYLQKFNTTPMLTLACPMAMSSCNPLRLVMEGDVAKTNPVLANNLNGSACPMTPAGMESSCRPDSLALNYLEADNIKLAFLNFEDLSLARTPVTLSSGSTSNVTGALSSNGIDFFSAWSGIISRRTQIFTKTRSFTLLGTLAAPTLVAPDNAANLSMNTVTLEWTALMARPGLVYDVFVDDITSGSGTSFARQTNLTTNTTTIMGLLGNHDYRWWVEARDATGMRLESTTRRDFQVNDLNPPTAPGLAAQPANGVTWAPTRLYLSWAAATDPDMGDSIVGYDVYFVEGTTVPSDACPYKRVTTTNFIIQASTDGRDAYVPDMSAPAGVTCNMAVGGTRPIYLQAPDIGMPSRNYAWKVCSVNNHGVRTCSEVRQFNTDDSVVGWWRFDESPAGSVCPVGLGGTTAPGGDVGETVCDYSGKGNHGVPHGSPTWLPPVMGSMAEVLGGALQFDGMDDWIQIPNNVSNFDFSLSNQLTIEVIVNISSIDSSRMIISKGNIDGIFSFAFQFNAGRTVYNTSSLGVASSFSSFGSSTHLTVSSNTDANRLFFDGLLVNEDRGTNFIRTTSNDLLIGSHVITPRYFLGSISEVILYKKSLDNNEVYNSFMTK